MKNLVEKINAEYEVFVSNANAQVEKGNKAAGTRARKAALELSKLMKEFRKVSVKLRNKFITFLKMKGRMGYMRPFVMGVPWQLYLSMYYPIIWPVTVFVMLPPPCLRKFGVLHSHNNI